MEQTTYTLQELAQKYKVSERTVQQRIKDGKLRVEHLSHNCYRLVTNDDKRDNQSNNQSERNDKHDNLKSGKNVNKSLPLEHTILLKALLQILDPDLDQIENMIDALEKRIQALEANSKREQ